MAGGVDEILQRVRARGPLQSSHSDSSTGDDFNLHDGEIQGRRVELQGEIDNHAREQNMEGDLWTLSPRPTCHGMKLRRLQQSRPMANPHPWRLGEDASVPTSLHLRVVTAQYVRGRVGRNGNRMRKNGNWSKTSCAMPGEL
jgi:hypothetical protein